MKWTNETIMRWYRRLLILAAIAVVFVLAWLDTAPTGHLTIRHNFDGLSPFVSEVVPVQRTEIRPAMVTIKDEPVYLTIRYPRPFRSMSVTLGFENPQNLFLEMGPQALPGESYQLYGLNHPKLNAVDESTDWSKIAAVSATAPSLWQRRSASYHYGSLEQFAGQLPPQEQAGFYGTDWPTPYQPDFRRQQQAAVQTVPVPLSGSHVFYVATAADTFAMHAEVYDLNRQVGQDSVTVRLLSWSGERLAEQELVDDGNSSDDGRLSSRRELDLVHTGLARPGVYRVEVNASSDVILRGLTFQAPYAAAKGHLAIAGGPTYRQAFGEEIRGPIHLITSARHFVAQTDHISSRQTLRMGEEALVVEQPFMPYEYRLSDTRRFPLSQGYVVTLEQGNIQLDGAGVFAVTGSGYFSPWPWLLDETVDPDVLELDYILATYTPPTKVGNQRFEQTLAIALDEVYAPDKSLRLKIAAPDMQPGQSFSLVGLRVGLQTEPITWSNAWVKLTNFFRREIAN